MNKLVLKFLGGSGGRVVRIVVGLALIGAGLAVIRGAAGIIIAVVGLLPLAAGVFDFCVLGPLLGLPFLGPRFRRAVESR